MRQHYGLWFTDSKLRLSPSQFLKVTGLNWRVHVENEISLTLKTANASVLPGISVNLIDYLPFMLSKVSVLLVIS